MIPQLNIEQIKSSPMAPKLVNPTMNEAGQLKGYWRAVEEFWPFIAELQNEKPGWLPEFKLIDLN